MSQRNTSPLKRSTVRRTLQRFWGVTRTQPLIVFLSVFSSAGYIFLLTFANTYVMALIVDRVQAGPVAGDQVFEVFGPYILALVLVNLVGQILSKLQDYTVYKLEIAGNYHLARLCFDTLSNQSMTFHTSRFGGSLVSQTSRFMSGYTGLVDVTVYSLIPTITSVICTVAALAPVVPTFTVILVCIMAVYIAFVWLMYKRIMPLSAATSAAQNKLSGVLSDAVTNILAVKTCGREDFERDLFDAADRAARDAETVSMHAMMQRNFTTSGLIVITMAVVSVFVAGGNAWFGISAGSLVMIFTYTYNLTMRLNYVSSMMQRINRALGDAAEMTRVLDEPRLVADDPDAPELKVTEGAIDFEQLSFELVPVAKDGLAATAAVDMCVAPGNLHAGFLAHIQLDRRLFRRGGDEIDNLLSIHLGCVTHMLFLLRVGTVDNWLGEHDLVERIEAGVAGDELLCGCQGAVDKDLTARGTVGERDLLVLAKETHLVHAGDGAAAQRVHTDLLGVTRAAHALAAIDGVVACLGLSFDDGVEQ